MIVFQAYQFKLKTNDEIEHKFRQFSGSCRFVWNIALALIKDRLNNQKTEKIINKNIPVHYRQQPYLPSYVDLAKMLTFWKKTDELSFLKEAHSQILQQKLKDLDKAIKSAFTKGNGICFPKFKRKYKNNNSFRYPQDCKIEGSRVFLPKIGWVRFFKSRNIAGKPKYVTVKQYADGWYVSIMTKIEIDQPELNHYPAVGIDAGVKKIVTLSNGYYFTPLDFYKLEKRLLKAQRVSDRKQHPRYKGDKTKCSKNFYKQKQKINRIHKRIADKRYDYLHKISTAIAKNHGIAVVEELRSEEHTSELQSH